MSLSHSGISNSGSRTGPYAAPVVDGLAPTKVGNYQLLAKLASGGMATVYLGRRTGLGGFDRRVAIKLLHPHLAEDADVRAMFLDEARLAAQIRHPNVVPVVDVGDEPMTGTYLVMEFIEGSDLAGVLKSATKKQQLIPAPVVIRIVRDMLAGLEAAHELRDSEGNPLNVVHRDVSPHNLIVGLDGVSRITDFGIAKAEGRIASTRTGQLKGKLAYMAPERLRGLEEEGSDTSGDLRGDLFGTAVVLWEALVGRRLFRGGDDLQTARLVLEKDIQPPSTYIPMLNAIDAIVMRGLERAPEQRYSSAREFREALEAVAPKLGGMATPSEVSGFLRSLLGEQLEKQRSAVEAAVKASEAAALEAERAKGQRSGPSPWAAVAVVLAVALAGGGFAWWQSTQRGPVVTPIASPPTVAGPEPEPLVDDSTDVEEPEPDIEASGGGGEQAEPVDIQVSEPARRRRRRRPATMRSSAMHTVMASEMNEESPPPDPAPMERPSHPQDEVLENPYGI